MARLRAPKAFTAKAASRFVSQPSTLVNAAQEMMASGA